MLVSITTAHSAGVRRPQLDAFIKSDPNVRVVYKDWPILAASSVLEAKAALATNYQGRYQLAISVRPATKEAVKAAVQAAGIDIERLNKDLAAHNDEIEATLRRDNAEAEALGFRSLALS